MTEKSEAAAALMQMDGDEISSILLEVAMAKAAREGRALEPADHTEAIGILLAAAWHYTKLADANPDGGRAARYAALLRRHADSVELLG